MNDNVRQIFNMLGVEPNEIFKVRLCENAEDYFECKIDEKLQVYCLDGVWDFFDEVLNDLLNGTVKIIKLPKEPKKKKLRDLTPEEFDKWKKKNCGNCLKCIFAHVFCGIDDCWVNHKDLYSDKFLEQEIEEE